MAACTNHCLYNGTYLTHICEDDFAGANSLRFYQVPRPSSTSCALRLTGNSSSSRPKVEVLAVVFFPFFVAPWLSCDSTGTEHRLHPKTAGMELSNAMTWGAGGVLVENEFFYILYSHFSDRLIIGFKCMVNFPGGTSGGICLSVCRWGRVWSCKLSWSLFVLKWRCEAASGGDS